MEPITKFGIALTAWIGICFLFFIVSIIFTLVTKSKRRDKWIIIMLITGAVSIVSIGLAVLC